MSNRSRKENADVKINFSLMTCSFCLSNPSLLCSKMKQHEVVIAEMDEIQGKLDKAKKGEIEFVLFPNL